VRCLSFEVEHVLLPLAFDPISQLGVFAGSLMNIAVPVDSAVVGKFAQTEFPGSGAVLGAVGPPIETYVFQCLDSEGGQVRCLSFDVKLVLRPLVCDP
jgi:hypothetical protein